MKGVKKEYEVVGVFRTDDGAIEIILQDMEALSIETEQPRDATEEIMQKSLGILSSLIGKGQDDGDNGVVIRMSVGEYESIGWKVGDVVEANFKLKGGNEK